MSKMDALRAMREAHYGQAATKPTRRPAPAAAAKTAAQKTARPAQQERPEADPEPQAQLCGHRNMSGRTCTREHGHAAKSHRYS